MTKKMILLMMVILIISIVSSSSSSFFSSSSSTSSTSSSMNKMTFGNSLLALLSSNDNAECKDGVCSIPDKKSSTTSRSAKDIFKSKILDLESKGISELEKKTTNDNETKENFIPTSSSTNTDNATSVSTNTDTTTSASTDSIPSTTPTNTNIDNTNTPNPTSTDTTNDSDINDKVSELVKMGWKKDEALDALKKTNYDVGSAASKLEEDQEENQKTLVLIKELEDKGWSPEASESAIKQCDGNVTSAIAMLEKEEKIIVDEFETAVKGMLENGWEEVVARQALLAQWTIDQRKAMGVNTTIPAEVLSTIKPTLKKIKEDEDTTTTKSKPAPKGSKGQSQGPQPKRANKEDCVFDVTAANFQKVVLESPCPVLLDIYADWCGPCKQLGPILEEAAMKSGGMFRLAKVNSDNERAIAETLRVQGLPTVFSVSKGKFTDRFVGMLPQEQLQQFLVRTITGYGDRVQKNEVTDSMMDDATKDISQLAGLATLDFKKRERLRSLIDSALALPGGADEQGNLSNGAKVSIKYIANAGKDIRNPKFRVINTTTAIFSEEVASNECAMQLLDIAGFKKNESKALDVLELAHSNSAVITLVLNKVTDACQQKKFQKIKQTAEIGPSKSFRSKTSDTTPSSQSTPSVSTKHEKIPTEKAIAKEVKIVEKPKKGEVTMSVRLSDGSAIKQNIKTSMKLNEALTLLLKDTNDADWKNIEIRHPKRLELTRQSAELDSTIKELEFTEGLAIVVGSPTKAVSSSSSSSTAPKAKKVIKRKKGGTHTLLSTGITAAKKKKNNEYFGGDSTVTQAGEEDDDDDDDDDEDDRKKK